MADLVIARPPAVGRRVLQAVQRALARQRRRRRGGAVELAEQHAENRIAAKLVVVVEVLIAERQAEDALCHQGLHLVPDVIRMAGVAEAGGEAVDEPDGLVRLAQQQRAGVGRHHPAVEIRHHPTPAGPSESHLLRATLLHRGAFSNRRNSLIAKQVYLIRGPDAPQFREKSGLGRPADLTPEKVSHARQMIDSGQQSVTGMAKIIGVHRVTLHKALKRA